MAWLPQEAKNMPHPMMANIPSLVRLSLAELHTCTNFVHKAQLHHGRAVSPARDLARGT